MKYYSDASVEHGEKLLAIGDLFVEYTDALCVDLSFQQFDDELASLPGKYARPRGRLILAQDETSKWAGCIALRPMTQAGFCEMKRLYVRPGYRGQGVGETLVKMLLDEAVKAGYKTMRLDTLKRLESAIKLYTGFGFSVIPAYYDNPMDDVVYMERQL